MNVVLSGSMDYLYIRKERFLKGELQVELLPLQFGEISCCYCKGGNRELPRTLWRGGRRCSNRVLSAGQLSLLLSRSR